MDKKRCLVSACLLGVPCRYDGRSVPCARVMKMAEEGFILFPVCPEQLGGLPTPRTPAEIQRDGRVVTRDGRDVTENYLAGAREAVRLAALLGCGRAVLKARSPSCGCGRIYDGSFSSVLTEGMGCAARCLGDAGVEVMTEEDLPPAEGTNTYPEDRT